VTVHCRTREQWLASPDMQKLTAWISDGKLEDMLELPLPETYASSTV
jgi:hypothetical protein